MNLKLTTLLLCGLVACHYSASQELSYIRYDVTDGLAGSTVYCMLQDRRGILWFGTETGVSRFDGARFRNLSTKDGLPDNQVIEIFEDSKGRIWMAPFNKSVCYYYKGNIYNQQNDSLLKQIHLSGHVVSFSEDRDGNILLQQSQGMHLLTNAGVTSITMNGVPNFIRAGQGHDGQLHAIHDDSLFRLDDGHLIFERRLNFPYKNYRYASFFNGKLAYRTSYRSFAVQDGGIEKSLQFDTLLYLTKYSMVNDSLVAINQQIGSFVWNFKKNQVRTYLPGEAVSTTFVDKAGNYWFCTLNRGVFMLTPESIRNVQLRTTKSSDLAAYVLFKDSGRWLAGSDRSSLFVVKKVGDRDTSMVAWSHHQNLHERVTSIITDGNGGYFVGTDARIAHLDRNLKLIRYLGEYSVKKLQYSDGSLVIATGRNVILQDVANFQMSDTIWNERATTVLKVRDLVYIGTLDGLFIKTSGGKIIDIGKSIPELGKRITEILPHPDGSLWISTYTGIHILKDGKLISSITERNGLISNLCRTFNIFGNELWVGTNIGLQQLDISDPMRPRPVLLLSKELSSEVINHVLADTFIVAVGTPAGINFIEKDEVRFTSQCDIYLDKIINSGVELPLPYNGITLGSSENNIRFEYSGISFFSGGEIQYRYRLIGLDTSWRITRENFIDFPSLPAGDYKFELQALNRFGNESRIISASFFVEAKFWRKRWVIVSSIVLALAALWFLTNWRIRRIRHQEKQKSVVQQKIVSLEQRVLKSQMNPHFIFNSLNSIQHFVIDRDVEGANRFITGFSRLIRHTLDLSQKHEISISEEINYLTTYLELEKQRFDNKFVYDVIVDPALEAEKVFIPPIILQPFVENSIRHGIRLLPDNTGRISISFRKLGDYMECSIRDNGVGRTAAAAQKEETRIEYQSKGITMTSERIALLNMNAARPIHFHIRDMDNDGKVKGTEVVINFPL